eukprot:CAMPEP_0119536488 /NCGR_PEP_ID=MMETSP1344-20130328/49316_1 /TAXON_ID=236787 /ORGANISM="Florenciella parvula, Strain CCMP2471" /LENGTH=219 /DNA_ID=CAMNT_0007578569 /DNA_START=102 /DNA_END=762 /DNA_ORIENTATION=-
MAEDLGGALPEEHPHAGSVDAPPHSGGAPEPPELHARPYAQTARNAHARVGVAVPSQLGEEVRPHSRSAITAAAAIAIAIAIAADIAAAAAEDAAAKQEGDESAVVFKLSLCPLQQLEVLLNEAHGGVVLAGRKGRDVNRRAAQYQHFHHRDSVSGVEYECRGHGRITLCYGAGVKVRRRDLVRQLLHKRDATATAGIVEDSGVFLLILLRFGRPPEHW